MKNTKIVSTVGPSTESREKIEELVDNGVDVIRQNFSHSDHDKLGELFEKIREVTGKTAVMADTRGPEIRLREVEEDTVIEEGHTVELAARKKTADEECLSLDYEGFLDNIEPGDRVRIDDGNIELEVEEVSEKAVCQVVQGGEVLSRKSVNIPGRDIGLSAPTEEDREDIRFAARKGYDFVSLSFVKDSSDVEEARKILNEEGSDAHIISKIEHRRAVENFESILEVSDAVMIARGDLGVEMDASRLPVLQKKMIKKANKAGKPVITATQMLSSMIENPTATRAEICDVANAVIDGSDAVMLSGETAVGEHPVKTVKFMKEIIEEAENSIEDRVHHTVKESPGDVAEIISKNAWQAARDSEADYIVAHTSSGSTARKIAKYRPEKPIIAFSSNERCIRQLRLAWGIQPYYEELQESVEDMLSTTAQRMKTLGLADEGTEIVVSAGVPTGTTGTTNMLQVRKLEDLLN